MARLSGQLIEALMRERRHQVLLDGVLAQLARWLGEDAVQDAISEAIARDNASPPKAARSRSSTGAV